MKVEIYEDAAGEWRWRLKAANGHIVANGGEGFVTKHTCRESVETIGENLMEIWEAGDDVEIEELEEADVEA